jgi:hypothetical protein
LIKRLGERNRAVPPDIIGVTNTSKASLPIMPPALVNASEGASSNLFPPPKRVVGSIQEGYWREWVK